MADTARDNLDQGLAMPWRLDGHLSQVKAVAVVVGHPCEHGGRQRGGIGICGRHGGGRAGRWAAGGKMRQAL